MMFAGADWAQFRGPSGSSLSDETGVPLSWSADENILWKTALPGFGASSPISCSDRIFVTCYSGYGLDEDEPGQQGDLLHHVVCIDRADGKILWDRKSKARLPETDYGGFVALHGYASGTPVSDGKAVYAFFGRSGVRAYDLEGQPLWKADVGGKTHGWGSGTSPILAGDLLIVNASVESQSIVALDKATGKEIWRAEGIERSWSTPALVDLPDGKQELVVSMHGSVRGYDPATGDELWQCAGVNDYVCPMVVAHEGIVYVTGGRRPQTVAIRAGGRGDVTETHLLWEKKKCSKVPSPLFHDGLLYWVGNRGIACCFEAETGELVYEERLRIRGGGDKVYASLVLADGKLYAVSRVGGTVVLAVGREFKELARNDLGDESVFNATPVVSDGTLLLRSDRFLYCIGE
jgi:outer membrane protein assembly factor BamB